MACFPTPALFDGNLSEFLDETYPAKKLEGFGRMFFWCRKSAVDACQLFSCSLYFMAKRDIL